VHLAKTKAIRDVPAVTPELKTKYIRQNGNWYLISTISNNSEYPLLLARIKIVGEKSHRRILPVLYSDNYLTIIPGEDAIIKMELKDADTRGEKPVVAVEALNSK